MESTPETIKKLALLINKLAIENRNEKKDNGSVLASLTRILAAELEGVREHLESLREQNLAEWKLSSSSIVVVNQEVNSLLEI